MKLLPDVDTSYDDYGLDITSDIIIVCFAYVSILAYLSMLTLELNNVYYYLFKQGKYKVFCLTLFYTLVIPCTTVRVFTNVFIVTEKIQIEYMVTLFPIILKTCIGFQ